MVVGVYFEHCRMKPVEAIEFALRLKKGPMKAGEVLHLVKGLLIEDGVDEGQLLAHASSHPERFLVRQDTIDLLPVREANRVGFFRERMTAIREALRMNRLFGSSTLGVEIALIYATATRKKDVLPFILEEGTGIWPALTDLANEFPFLVAGLEGSLKKAWTILRDQVQNELLLLASVRLTPEEYVHEVRASFAGRGELGQYCLPWAVAELMTKLLGGGVKEVFDPAADASVLPVVQSLHRDARADAVFMNSYAQFFTTVQSRILGTQLKTCLNDRQAMFGNNRYLHCISAPPFGGRIKQEGALRAIEPYELAINQVIKHLAPGGIAVVLVPETMLYSGARAQFRKSILDQGILRAVISLPVGTFRPVAEVKSSILVFDRSLSPGSSVRFVDAGRVEERKLENRATLDVEDIIQSVRAEVPPEGALDVKLQELRADEHVSWSMSRFVSQLLLERIVAGSPGVDVVELGTALHDDILSLGSAEGLPLFQVTELSTDVLDLVRTAHNGVTDRAEIRKGARRLDAPALLVARVGGKLKPTLFDPGQGSIAVGSNVFMFRVDTLLADPEYLAIELRSPLVQDQLDAYHQGSTIASIAKADLLRIRVRLPGLPEQQRIVRERKEAILLAKREEIARQEKQHGLSTDEWRIMGAVEHSFRPVLALVEQPMEAIRQLTSELDAQKQIAVSAELAKVNAGLDRMRGLFKLINDVISSDKESIRRVPVDLRRLFRTEVRGLALELKKLQVYFQCEAGLETPDGVIAKVDPRQFALVVQNLLTNMAKHACRPEMKELHVLVRVGTRQEPGRTWLVITIENDGKPFPEGFTHRDLITFGKRLDATNGNGIGGYLMDRIIANHNGRFTSCNLDLDERMARSGFTEEQCLYDNRGESLNRASGSIDMTVRFTIEIPVDNTDQDH